nr:hypothetical protein CFP56_23195 [Quercus suber]
MENPHTHYPEACMWIDDDQDNEFRQEINGKDFEVEVSKIEANSNEEDGTKHKDLSKKKIGLSIRRMEKWK